MHARFVDTARHRERAQTLAAIAAVRGKPIRTFVEDVAHPVQRLHIVFERRVAEQPHLRHIRRTQPRHAAFAFDGFDHRGFFAADVRTRATPQINRRQRARRSFLQRCNFFFEDGAHPCIFVAQVNVDLGNLHHPRGDDYAFEESMRIAFEVHTILERARLAFVNIHRHHTRAFFGAHDAPLAPRRETRAAQTTQAGGLHHFDQVLGFALARQTFLRDAVTARIKIIIIIQILRYVTRALARGDQRLHLGHGRMRYGVLPDHRHRRLLAAPHAWRGNHAHAITQRPF